MVLLVNVASLSLSLYSLSPMSPPLHKAGPNGDSKAQPSDGTRPMHPVCLWLQSPTHTAHTQQAQLLRSDVRMSPFSWGQRVRSRQGGTEAGLPSAYRAPFYKHVSTLCNQHGSEFPQEGHESVTGHQFCATVTLLTGHLLRAQGTCCCPLPPWAPQDKPWLGSPGSPQLELARTSRAFLPWFG